MNENQLKEMYEITKIEILLSDLAHRIRGNKKIPRYIKKLSHKKYGRCDNLSRYYSHKYFGIPVGKFTYGYRQFCDRNSSLVSIGAFCSIAGNVKLVAGNHPTNYISTSPVFYSKDFGLCNENNDVMLSNVKNGKIFIGNDVWIGENVSIISPVKINNGAVIGAGAVVTKDVPAYSIVGGVPAKVIKYRFPPETIDALLEIHWEEWSNEKIKENIELFSNVDEFIAKFGTN